MENNYMADLFTNTLEAAKKDHKYLKALKTAFVKCQQFELAANIRQLEKDLFPETPEQIEAKESAKNLNALFRMVDLNISEEVCWLISETLKAYNKKKGSFSIRHAADLKAKQRKLFPKDDE